MRYMSQYRFHHLKIYIYPDIRLLNNHTIIKSINEPQYRLLKEIEGKKIDNVILPKHFYKLIPDMPGLSNLAYTQKRVKNFIPLAYFKKIESRYSDKEILMLFRNLFTTEYNMHKEDVTSRDMHNKNILINEELDHRIIDFDCTIYPACIDHFTDESLFPNYDTLERHKLSDKVCLLWHFLYGMRDGHFEHRRNLDEPDFLEDFHLPREIEEKWKLWVSDDASVLDKDEYFLEDFNTLIEENYKLPYRR